MVGCHTLRTVHRFSMTYDVLGNITQRKDGIDETQTEDYGYDAISQLVSFKRGTAVDKTYQFDLLGNRVRTVENGIITNYTVNNVNAYTNVNGKFSFMPQYDENGNLLNDDKHTYVYNFNNKLIAVDGTVGQYAYDAFGRRISKTTAEGTTNYYYVGDQMVEEYVDNTLSASYLYGNNIDEALQMTKGENRYYYHINHLGSTLALTNDEGALTERVAYGVYGEPTFSDVLGSNIARSSVGNTILFTGREYDYESGIYYFRARSLHPQIGRFMQHDPLMYVDGMNDYTYVINSPLIYLDNYGLDIHDDSFINRFNELKKQEAEIEKNLGPYNPGNKTNISKSGATPKPNNFSKPSSNYKLDKPFGYNVKPNQAENIAKQTGKQFAKNTGKDLLGNIGKKIGMGLAKRAPIAGVAALADSPIIPVGDIVGGVFLLGGIGMDIYYGYKEFKDKEFKEIDCENF